MNHNILHICSINKNGFQQSEKKTGWFIIYLPVLIILGALFFVSSLD
jgi:hypothetical protein